MVFLAYSLLVFPVEITYGLKAILCSVQWTQTVFQSLPQASNITSRKHPCKLILVSFIKFFRLITMLQKKKKKSLQLFPTEFLSNSLVCLLAQMFYTPPIHFYILRIQVFPELAKLDWKMYSGAEWVAAGRCTNSV